MTIRAQSADGQLHEFPDGTDGAVIDRVMKEYAQSKMLGSGTGRASTDAGRVATIANGATLGFGDEVMGGIAYGTELVRSGFDTGKAAKAYDEVTETMRAPVRDYAEDNPWSSMGLTALGGAPLAIASAPAMLTRAGVSTAGRLGGASLYGGALGGVAGFGEGEGGLENRLEGAGWGGATGAVAGPAFQALGMVFRRLLPRGPFRVVNDQGALTPEGAGIFREAGVDPSQVPSSVILRLDEVARRSGGRPANPGAGIRMAEAESLPARVPLSRGQATGDISQLAEERALSRSGGGMGIMRDFRDQQQAALGNNVTAFRERIAGGNPVYERNQGGSTVSGDLNARYDAASARSNALYDTARREGEAVAINADVARGTAQRIATRLTADHAAENIPAVQREVNRIVDMAAKGDVSVRQMFEARQRLTSMRATPGEQAVAAGKAVRELDQALYDALDLSLMNGDEAGIQAWRDAIGNYRDFAQTFKQRDMVGKLVARTPGGGQLRVDPRQAANEIFGTSNLGFVNKRDIVRDLQKMRGLLGEDSEAWSAIRQEAFNRLAEKGLGASTPDGRMFSGANFAKAWEDATRKNPEVMRMLFTAQERRDIGNFANVARRVTTADPAVYAPSMNAYEAQRALLTRLGRRIPWVGHFVDGLDAAAGMARDVAGARAATGGRLPLAPRGDGSRLGALGGPVGQGILKVQRQ